MRAMSDIHGCDELGSDVGWALPTTFAESVGDAHLTTLQQSLGDTGVATMLGAKIDSHACRQIQNKSDVILRRTRRRIWHCSRGQILRGVPLRMTAARYYLAIL